MPSILLAGSSGNIGKYLFKNLKDKHALTTISRSGLNASDIRVELDDLAEIKNQLKNIERPDCLIFLVGRAHKKGKKSENLKYRKDNYQSLINLLSALNDLKKNPDKIIFTSTISVYGENYNNSIYDENYLPNPASPYALTKHESEKYLQENFIKKSWILRLAPVYSKDFMRNIDRRTKLLTKFHFKVGSGNKNFSLCDIENIQIVIDGILNNSIPAGIYNVSDQPKYSYKFLLNYLNSKFVIKIPTLIIKIIYNFSKFFGMIYLTENTIKLLTDNLYPSQKINNYVTLTKSLKK